MSVQLLDGHEIEIERRGEVDKECRVSCSCGFIGPWRKTRSTAAKDSDDHEERVLERNGAEP